MGILEQIKEPLAHQIAQRGAGVVLGSAFVALLVVTVVLNVLSQLLFKNPNEPPVVFHWFPLIGNTITYGMDPYGFFFDCKAKVPCPDIVGPSTQADRCVVRRLFHVYFAWKEVYGLSWQNGQRFHSQWEAEGRER